MTNYELTVLIHPDLEMNIAPATDKIAKLIKDNGGKITKEVSEGKKHLSYPISAQNFAIFYYYEVELPPAAPQKISNVLNITDEVIRYLLVKEDERKLKIEARRKTSHRPADDSPANEPASNADDADSQTNEPASADDAEAETKED